MTHKIGAPNIATFATVEATRENDVTANAIGRGAVVLGKLLTVTVEAGAVRAKGKVAEHVQSKSISVLLQEAFELSMLAKAAKDAEKLYSGVAIRQLLERFKTDGVEAVVTELREAMSAQGMPEPEIEALLSEFTVMEQG